jgi:hypothetical protein
VNKLLLAAEERGVQSAVLLYLAQLAQAPVDKQTGLCVENDHEWLLMKTAARAGMSLTPPPI